MHDWFYRRSLPNAVVIEDDRLFRISRLDVGKAKLPSLEERGALLHRDRDFKTIHQRSHLYLSAARYLVPVTEIYRSRICALICNPHFGTKSIYKCHCEDVLLGDMALGLPCPPMPSLFFIFVFLSGLASAAVISQTLQSATIACVTSRDWIDNGYVKSDCTQAIERFIREENFVHGDQEFEFLAPGVSPIHSLPTLRTPRRYTVGQSFFTACRN